MSQDGTLPLAPEHWKFLLPVVNNIGVANGPEKPFPESRLDQNLLNTDTVPLSVLSNKSQNRSARHGGQSFTESDRQTAQDGHQIPGQPLALKISPVDPLNG